MSASDTSAEETADLLLQLGRAAYAECSAGGLTQAQWMAIRFFARANRFSRTVSGFAQFHATTRGTASQTVAMLVDKGYLARSRSERDARSVRFDLTALARKTLCDDPLGQVTRAAGKLGAAERNRLTGQLRAMLVDIETQNGQATTGVCRLCGHLDNRGGPDGAQCLLMKESLETAELEELCVRFSPS